ncbi:S1 family peptidase [Streptomyces sp. NPDC051940]|uniref:S1 family peptidase n=1 Tax=Streptomyces sp. NPDC051940 TaxID=3155675 RepID=UPI003428EB31
MLRRRAVLPGIAAAIAALCISVLPASASTAAPGPDVDPAVLEALQRDLGLTSAEAKTRVRAEAEAAVTDAVLRKSLGARFAGSWVSGTAAELTVATTDRSALDDIAAHGAKARLVGRSATALDAVKAVLDRAVQSAAPAGTPLWYVDVRTNTVAVQSSNPAATRAFLARSGADTSAIRLVKATDSPRTLYDIKGGDAYYINGSSRCSVGFPITRGTTQGFVTAGHCGTAGASTTGYNQVAQGTFQGSSFPGNDYAWVAANSNWTSVPYVKGSGGANVTVNGSTQAPVGSSVCRSGSTTGWHCGSIQQHNTSVTYAQGTVSGVTRTSVCAEPGDSGGSFISGDQAQGVTSGGSGNCTSGGTTYYQPVNEILTTYGLTLKTGGGTEPPPTGCQGSQQTYSGSLSSGGQAVQPNGSYYYSGSSGTHTGCLTGPSGADFDLYLQKWNGSSWSTVAEGITPEKDENISYSGTAGYYRYLVHAYSGSGSYTLGVSKPA